MNKRILIKFIGEDGKLITDSFDSAVLRGQMSVSMPPGSAGNNSRAQQANDLKTFLPILLQGQVDDPEMKTIFLQKVMDFMSWGEETRTISLLNRQENFARSWINEIKNSANRPDFNVQVLLQPFINFKVWKSACEEVLLDKEEFGSWAPVCKERLTQLWQLVVEHLTQLQQEAAASINGGAPTPGPGAPTPGPGAPSGPPMPPHPPAGAPPHLPLQSGGRPSIIQQRVPQLTQSEGQRVPTQEPANA